MYPIENNNYNRNTIAMNNIRIQDLLSLEMSEPI
jgi:hypothetical protein